MKYYGIIGEINNLEAKGFPNKFPMFAICTEEEKRRYSATMVKASHFGFNPKIRKLCFTLRCNEGYTHEEVFELVKTLPEIPEDVFKLLKDIPHWNPIIEATQILERYIEMVDANIEIMEKSEDTREALNISFEDTQKIREIFINA
jgi:hypothetical protein